MRRIGVLCAVLTVAALVAGPALSGPASAPAALVDGAFNKFWAARTPYEAARFIDEIIKTGISFDETLKRLEAGRPYTLQRTGVVRMSNKTEDSVEHFFAINVPEKYDPARRYTVRFHLHGGVMGRPDNQPRGTGEIGALAGAEQIYVIPYSWRDAPWWSDDQILNLNAILDTIKRSYNVDENHVVVSGVSDGGTGAYFIAMRETTPFASFLPLDGFLMVLALDDIDDGSLFPNNLRNKPFFAVNGEPDPLYPTGRVGPYVRHLIDHGVQVSYHPQPSGVHNTAWWPEVKESFEKFVSDHPRDPHPDKLTWETTARSHNRAHWLVIDQLSDRREASAAERPLATAESTQGTQSTQRTQRGTAAPEGATPEADDDANVMVGPDTFEFGARTVGPLVDRVLPGTNAEKIGLVSGDYVVRINDKTVPLGTDLDDVVEALTPGSPLSFLVGRQGSPIELAGTYQPVKTPGTRKKLFARGDRTGRVDLVRTGNTIDAAIRGVDAFTLLLSPARFDFTQRITVVANGRTVFNGRVEPSVRTLLKWAARDNDRTMLYGAELHINVAR